MPTGRDWSELRNKGVWIPSNIEWIASGLIRDVRDLEPAGWVKLTLTQFQVKPGAEQTINGSRDLRLEITDSKTNQVLEILRACSLMNPVQPSAINGLVDGPVEFECRAPPQR